MKLRNSPKSAGQSDVQQFHFPTALLPSSHSLSGGLNSAFTYDDGELLLLLLF